jgi:hypothetical protein
MYELMRPTPEHFRENMDKYVTWFQQIADASGGEFKWNHIPRSVDSGDLEAWGILEDGELIGFMCGQIIPRHSGHVFSVVGLAATGENADWQEFDNILTEICKVNDCVAFEARGRRGWLRSFKKYGWKEKYTVLRKEI